MEIGRKHPARQPVFASGNQSPIVFLTVCTQGRQPILASREVEAVLIKAWTAADHWLVGRYVLLPDHLHLFCAPSDPESPPIKGWIRYWKSLASRAWPRREDHPVWQLDGWDTQLRRGESYDRKWDYVRHNPVRHGLVDVADAWPFQGELNALAWHDA